MRLAEAVAVVTPARQHSEQPEGLAASSSTLDALEAVKVTLPTPAIVLPELSFESLFRTAAGQRVSM
jgi:hypothetical protein